MKPRVRALSALLIIAFLTVPSLVASEQLAVPLERGIHPGVTTVLYANHTLVFTTAVPLKIRLCVVPAGHVQLSLMTTSYNQGQGNAPGSSGQTVIFWEEVNQEVYSGNPSDSWIDIPLAESGWTEK